MFCNCEGVPLARRGFSATGNRSSLPLSMEMTMNPSSKRADRAISVKVLMPLLNDKRLIGARKLLGTGQLPHLQAHGLAQLDHGFDIEDRFTGTVAHMDVDGP